MARELASLLYYLKRILVVTTAGISLVFANSMSGDQTDSTSQNSESTVTLGFYGEITSYVSDYTRRGGVSSQDVDVGSEVSLGTSLEWESGAFMHELELYISGETSTEKDSSSWNFTPTVEYSLIGSSFVVDASVDLNFYSDRDMLVGSMLWLQKRLWKNDDLSLNGTAWGYYRSDGRILVNANLNVKKSVKLGLSGAVYVGAKLDGDSLETRVGPNGKVSVSYGLPYGFSLEVAENLFYGFVTSTEYLDGEDMDELVSSSDMSIKWKGDFLSAYLTLRNWYRYYTDVPIYYDDLLAVHRNYFSAKIGLKVAF